MKPQYIANFEKLGFGMFVHFGLYSMVGKGEWHYWSDPNCDREKYFSEEFANKFNPKKNWAINLVKEAKKAGAKYITLTTKHHEGYFLYDSCGLTTWDSMHLGPKRDLVREFVDACNKEGIVPFLYYAIYDWHNPDYENNFPKYVDFMIRSVEILCSNYGKIGGLWFDGYWNKPNEDWQFDRMYKTIRKYQPEAMIINNTGMSDTGAVSHYEIDSVTFERGKPFEVSSADGKERAGEMCEVFAEHWGYASEDINYKPMKDIINTLVTCRNCNCNLLLNVGPKGDGTLKDIDKAYLRMLGMWIKKNKNFIYDVKKGDVEVKGAKVLMDDKYYYAVVENVPMAADVNVQLGHPLPMIEAQGFKFANPKLLDNGQAPETISKDKKTITIDPYVYGQAYCARVVRFKVAGRQK